MSFVYSYKTPDGQRHDGEINAPDREAAFAALRERGIRAIRVEPKGWQTGVGRTIGLKRWLTGLVLFLAVGVTVGIVFGRRTVRTAAVPATSVEIDGRIARARPRHQLGGPTANLASVFAHPSEQFLSLYAEPGKRVERIAFTDAVVEDFHEALQDVIIIEDDDPPPVVELKGIVAGMKEDLALYLKGGNGVRDYVQLLASRQAMEEEFRNSVIRKVESGEMPIEDANNRLGVMGFAKIPVTRMGEKK